MELHAQGTGRLVLDRTHIDRTAEDELTAFHADVLREVRQAIEESPVVVVGMAQNPHVRQVRRALAEAGVEFRYLEYGSYLSKWKERLAIKMWSGWPTFPQVFVRGVLLGGKALTVSALRDGKLKQLLARDSA